VVRWLLAESEAHVFKLDKTGYASDLTSIEQVLQELGSAAAGRHQRLRVDLSDGEATAEAVRQADPDLMLHLAAESHVDRSIEGPEAFLASNVSGTFHLLQAVRAHWEQLSSERQAGFRFHHISTDEVFGSLGETGRFSETTPYDPRSPYSASKAASDHLVNAWHHTYGPWQFPEKLIPVVILKAAAGEPIPLYGDGLNVRDWLYVEDHVDALLPAGAPHSQLITPVSDRPGHDRRYAIDPTRISSELGWQPRLSFQEGLAATVAWYLKQQDWRETLRSRSGYQHEDPPHRFSDVVDAAVKERACRRRAAAAGEYCQMKLKSLQVIPMAPQLHGSCDPCSRA
jgi:dTDP-glucose 4,6-dehydratase